MRQHVEMRPSKTKPEKVVYVSHWGFSHNVFLQRCDLARSAAWRYLVRLPDVLRASEMTKSAFVSDLAQEIPCAVLSSTGLTFLTTLDALCNDLPQLPARGKRRRRSDETPNTDVAAPPAHAQPAVGTPRPDVQATDASPPAASTSPPATDVKPKTAAPVLDVNENVAAPETAPPQKVDDDDVRMMTPPPTLPPPDIGTPTKDEPDTPMDPDVLLTPVAPVRPVPALPPCVPQPPPGNNVIDPHHPAFDGRYVLGSSDQGLEAPFFRQDYVDPAWLNADQIKVGQNIDSSGNVIQERAFLQAFGREINDRAFVGHISSPFRYEIDEETFVDDPECAKMDTFLNDSLNNINSTQKFGEPPHNDDDVMFPTTQYMMMLGRHREFAVQAVDSLLQAAKITSENSRHAQELHTGANAYALGQAHARRDWAADTATCSRCLDADNRAAQAEFQTKRHCSMLRDLDGLLKIESSAKTAAEDELKSAQDVIAQMKGANVAAQQQIADLTARLANVQTKMDATEAARTDEGNDVTPLDSPAVRQELRTLQLELHRHVSPRQLKRVTPAYKQLEKVVLAHLQGDRCPTHSVTLEDGSTADVTVVDMDDQASSS